MFHGPTAIAAGLITQAQLRSPAWRRLLRGVYADADLPVTHELRCRAVARYALATGGALAGRSAATILGPGLSEPQDPVEVVVPAPDVRSRTSEVINHVADVPPADLCQVRGMPVTTPLRTCWDLGRWLPVTDAVVLVDRFLQSGLVTAPELAAYAARRKGLHGAARFASVSSLVDGRAESPQESRLRVALVLAGLPIPQVQWKIHDAAGFVARVDLAYPAWRIAIEYDGVWHANADQLSRDRRRLNRLQAAGWLVIHVTSDRLRNDLPSLLNELNGAIAVRR
ncbi:endonuclease domain-containing protein [Luedemannella helvata]|uniref:DUF559 domain-containing protein n=1 Tax=Luedemannella helvata TaxID=349315 RepID=A0ABP4W007_9ACTN